ncbi:MAG: Ltp family lipoprotein [Culicoidibacterales bacterium]
MNNLKLILVGIFVVVVLLLIIGVVFYKHSSRLSKIVLVGSIFLLGGISITEHIIEILSNAPQFVEPMSAEASVHEELQIENFVEPTEPVLEMCVLALEKAEFYSSEEHFSKARVFELLTKDGDQFSFKAAQYAMRMLEADWNENALYKARDLQAIMKMPKTEIYEQLISSYGEKFTDEEARYAIANLE